MTTATTARPVVRPATGADWESISSLLSNAQLPLDGARDQLPRFRVAELDGIVVGCAATERYGTDALLRSVAVSPAHHGRAIGATLVARVLDETRDEGIQTVVLLTTTAAGWFPRFGFQQVHRDEAPASVRDSVEFRSACPASAVTMLLRHRR